MGEILNILVVEDDSSIRMLLQDVLHISGYKVRVAENGCEALVKISEKMPDVVITDWQMPKMSGIQLIAEIRRFYPSIKVILMSSEESIEKTAIAAGANGFILKPFHFHQVVLKIKNLF